MCTGIEIAMIAGTLASGATAYSSQRQAAKSQEQANNQSRALGIQNQDLQIKALQNQEDEDRRRSSEALEKNQVAADAARATAAVAAGEAGVSGLSIDALLGDLTRQESDNRFDIESIHDSQQRQRQLDREGLGINAQSQINQLPLVNYPSFAETALTTAASATGSYYTAKSYQTKK